MSKSNQTRRKFLFDSSLGLVGISVLPFAHLSCNSDNGADTTDETEEAASAPQTTRTPDGVLKISLAEWSLHKALFSGEMQHLDFAAKSRELGIEAIEYVSGFFTDYAKDQKYLDDMNKRADDNGVKQLLIMIDGQGELATPDDAARTKAVENHKAWVDAAKYLGCHSIRVNCAGKGSIDEVQDAGIDGLGRVAEYAKPQNLNVIVENHGGMSSRGQWLAGVMRGVDMDNCGTLPDFGNFCIDGNPWGDCKQMYDRYKGMEELMPFAKAVSAKSYDFDEFGNESTIDFRRMIDIVKDADYRGYVGIEYEGERLGEEEGILATKALLEKLL